MDDLSVDFPPYNVVKLLVNTYFETAALNYDYLSKVDILNKINKNSNTHEDNFWALLYAIFAVAVQFRTPLLEKEIIAAYPLIKPEELQDKWYMNSKNIIYTERENDSINMHLVQASFLNAIYIKNEGRAAAAWLIIAETIRMAQYVGMHLESETLSDRESEYRRRLWWKLFEFDRFLSLIIGRPYSIQMAHCVAKKPANISSDFLDIAGETDMLHPLPFTVPTSCTYIFYLIDAARIAGVLLDGTIAYPTKEGLRNEIVHLLDSLEESLPVFLKLNNPDKSFDAEHPYLVSNRYVLQLVITFLRVTLYRPYIFSSQNPEYHGLAVEAACDMITYQSEFQRILPHTLRKSYLMPYFTFDSTVLLILAQNLISFGINSHSLSPWIIEGVELLTEIKTISSVAAHGMIVIKILQGDELKNGKLSLPYVGFDLDILSHPNQATRFSGPRIVNFVKWIEGDVYKAMGNLPNTMVY